MVPTRPKLLPRVAAALVLLSIGAACSDLALKSVPMAMVDATVVVNTDKTIIDHVASASSGQDCSTIRAQQGGHYCMPPYENRPVNEALYCYRTLAAVTCYDRPSTNPSDKLVGVQPAGRQQTW